MPADLTAYAREAGGRVERLTRAAFVDELAGSWRPGDHLSTIGPTGRGKSTLIGQLVAAQRTHDEIVILSPKGVDRAYAGLGHPTRVWPPRRPWEERAILALGLRPDRHEEGPKVWRLETPVRKIEDFARLGALYRAALASVLARRENARASLMVVIDDSRFVCDQLGATKLVTAGLIIGRSKRVSIVNNFQAPRFVPREGLDQITHAIIFRNRDRDVVKRLTDISGDLDPKLVESLLRSLDYHEALWIDGRADRLAVVGG